ncbi:MAG: hypothetical protein IKO21_03705 [Fibrobacter sp.]|nr:hypothetical protein [Fibrobacter sp.]
MQMLPKSLIVLGSLILLNACGDEKTVYYPSSAVSEIVDSREDLKKCTEKNNGDIVYVRDEHAAYICDMEKWGIYEEYDEPHIGGSDEDGLSSSSEKSGGKSSSSQSSKNESSSSNKSSSEPDEDSSDSEEKELSSSSSAERSSSSAFVCANDWYCSNVEEPCNEATIDNFAVLPYNDKVYYYRCMADGWMPSDLVEYDTFGKPCTSDADTAWGTHDFYDLKDSLNPYRKFYVCKKGSYKTYYSFEESNSTVLTFFDGIVCDDFHQNVVVQKKYSSFACHGTSWYLEDQYTGTMVDDRDGKEYKTVGIGDHIWMQENLMYKDVPAVEYGTYTVKQGPQYNWYTAANVSEKEWNNNPLKIKAPIQGICPDGWHLPTYRNFLELSDAIHGMVDDYYHSNNISSVKNSVKACYVGKNWSLFTNNSFEGKDCMNMKFLTVPRLESNGRVAKNDSNHTTAMWRSDTYDDFYAGSLNLSNAMYNETSMAFNENAYVRMEAFEVIRCVKDEEGEHIYKSPYDIPQ